MKEIRKESIVKFLKNKNNLLIIVLLGVLLMVIAIPVDTAGTGGKSASGSNNNSSYQTKNTGTGYQAGRYSLVLLQQYNRKSRNTAAKTTW